MSDIKNPVAAQKAPKISWGSIVDLDGVKIGVVGGTTPLLGAISSPGKTKVMQPGAGSNDMQAFAKIMQPRIDELTSQGIKIIVLTTHLATGAA
jgi:5'-nucleotidase/UDP-sugar diphosphatase